MILARRSCASVNVYSLHRRMLTDALCWQGLKALAQDLPKATLINRARTSQDTCGANRDTSGASRDTYVTADDTEPQLAPGVDDPSLALFLLVLLQ